MKIRITFFFLIAVTLATGGRYVLAQNVIEMDRQAQEYYEKKNFSKAIALWISILDVDPDNIEIQKKIEMIYERKQIKDLALEKARLNLKIARKTLFVNRVSDSMDVDNPKKLDTDQIKRNVSYIVDKSDVAIKSYISAYRIDPKDPEIMTLKDEMRQLEKDVKAEREKERLSLALKRKYRRLKELAVKEMAAENFSTALKYWEEILDFFSKDPVALEGKRKCKLAIDNRIRYERVMAFLKKGKEFFDNKSYKLARLEFVQALNLDEMNREAKGYIDQIDEKLEEIRFFEQRKQQAEDFYKSGLANLNNNNFDMASEDFESALALIENYKDARKKLESIAKLRQVYEQRLKLRKLQKINSEFQNGIIALSETRYAEAITSFSATLALDPGNELAQKYLGRARDAQKQIEEERVDEDSPYYDLIQSLKVSGINLYKQGRYEESRKQWDKILQLFPKNRIASEYLLRCDLKLNPGTYKDFAGRIFNEGKNFLAKNNYREALRKFQLLESIDSNYPGLKSMIKRAQAADRAGVTSATGPVEKKEIEQHYRRAMSLYKQGSRASRLEALKELKWIVARDSNNVKAAISINKIESELRIGGSTGAAAKRLTPEQMRLVNKYYYQGISYYSNNNFKMAIQEWRKVLAIDPTNVKAKNNIRKCLVFLGR